MSLQIGDVAPNFKAQTTMGEIDFYQWMGDDWAVLFSHPKDFTPVCTTELGEASKLKPKFEERGVKMIGISVDSVSEHYDWAVDIEETQHIQLNFPLIGDPDREVAHLYGMIHPNADDTLTVCSVFIIDSQKKVRLTMTYPASTGRNFAEILRTIDSLQLTSEHLVATPANWNHGDNVIIVPSLTTEQAKRKFPDGWIEEKPYLRYVRDPMA